MNISRLNQVVKDSGKSKVQLSKECGITRVTLDNALSGGDIRVSIVEAIAKALHINVGYLFDEELKTGDVSAIGVGSVAMGGNNNGSVATSVDTAKDEKIKLLEQLLQEKERLIKVLMSK